MLANLVVEFVHGGAWSPLGDRLGASVVRQENDPGVFPPIVLTSVPLEYTEQARRARIEGLVTVEVVVDVEGAVREARVVRSIDALHGLDEAALTAARRWTFEPGTVNGRPVPVSVTLVLEFRLH